MDLKPSQETIDRIRKLYGENRIIEGDYDAALAVKCNNGTFVGKENDGLLVFKGIPFAKPPVGSLRWRAPEEPEDSDVVKEAYYFGKSPIQTLWFSEVASCYPQSEDCLYLNIWADKNTSVKKPVMVFIHGGAFGWGGTSDPIYDGQNFVKEHPDVILVTIAYRLGLMGFMNFEPADGGDEYKDAFCLGILDQIQALKWIQKNIAAFGGDPDCVTVFGESAGAGSVSLLPIMYEAKGLFKRVIAESGSIALTTGKEDARALTERFLAETKTKSMSELMALSTEEIVKVNEKLNQDNNFPIRDGVHIPTDLYQAYKDGNGAQIDMISGTNKDELRYWIGEIGNEFLYGIQIPVLFENYCRSYSKEDVENSKKFIKHGEGVVKWRVTEYLNDLVFRVPALKQCEYHRANGGITYMYFWTYPSSIGHQKACHAVELSSVFNNPKEKIYTGENYNEKLAKLTRQMWVNFAKTGDPSTDEVAWPQYDGETRKTLVLGDDIYVKDDLYSRRRKVIEPLLKYKKNGTYTHLDLSVTYVKVMCGIIILLIAMIVALLIIIF